MEQPHSRDGSAYFPLLKPSRNVAIRELVTICIVMIVLAVVAFTRDRYSFSIANLEVDFDHVNEVGFLLAFLGFAMAVFAFRRWQDLRREVIRREEVEANLRRANQELMEWTVKQEQQNKEIELLSHLSGLLQACHTRTEAFAVISDVSSILFPGAGGCVLEINPSRNFIEPVSNWGDQAQGEVVLGTDQCWALRKSQPYIYDHIRPMPVCKHFEQQEKIVTFCFPIAAQGEAIGVFNLRFPPPVDPKYSEKIERLARSVTDTVGMALSNIKLNETLRSQAIQDPLTGLHNRRYMEVSLEREIRRAVRKQVALSVVMLDLDHFKKFNDTFGHDAGDVLLREFGYKIRHVFRADDIVCRYGGEEFIIILPEVPPTEAYQRLEDLAEVLRHFEVKHNGQLLGNVTFSAGIACFPVSSTTLDGLIQAADRALFQAKKNGRNQVVMPS